MKRTVGYFRYGRGQPKVDNTYAEKIAVQTLRLFHDNFFGTS